MSTRELIDALSALYMEINELKAQRDELLARLKSLYAAIDSCVELTPEIMNAVRETIERTTP